MAIRRQFGPNSAAIRVNSESLKDLVHHFKFRSEPNSWLDIRTGNMITRRFKPVFLTSALLILAASQSLLAQSSLFGSDTELLAVEMAFPAEASMSSADSVDVQFSVVDGYYLYKKKICFSQQQ